MSIKKKVISGLSWSAVGKLLTQIVTWSVTIVVMRLLTPADYGLMSMAGVLISFISVLGEFGIGAAIVQEKQITDEVLRSLFSCALLVNCCLYLVVYFCAPYVSFFYDEISLESIIQVIGIQFVIMSFGTIPRSLMVRDMLFRDIAIVDFSANVFGSLITLGMACLDYGVWSLVYGSLANQLLAALFFNCMRPFAHFPNFKIKEVRFFLSFGWYVTLSRLLWYGYSQSDVLIVGKMLGNELLGLYSVGLTLAALPMEKLSSIVTQVVYSAFSSINSDQKDVATKFILGIRMLGLISFPCLFGLSTVSYEVVNIFLGVRWTGAVVCMQIIAIVIPLRLISNFMSTAVLGAGFPRVTLEMVLISLIIMPISFYIGSSGGVAGVSLAWLIIYPVVFTINSVRVISVLGINYRNYFYALMSPFVSSCVMSVIVYIFNIYVFIDFHVYLRLILCVLIGVCAYIIMIRYVFTSFSDDFVAIVRAKKGRGVK